MDAAAENAAIEDALKRVKGMPGVGDAEVMQAFLRVPVECTKVIAERVRAYDATTAKLTGALVRATSTLGVVTFLLVLATCWLAWKTH